jgi:hypothetical protein
MIVKFMQWQACRRSLRRGIALLSISVFAISLSAIAQDDHSGWDRHFHPGNLVVSRSVYDSKANNVTVGTILPPGCASTTGGCAGPGGAVSNGLYPYVWNNNIYDGSFGITSRIFLDQVTPWGHRINSLEVPNSLERHITGTRDHMVTSFSSKSELALNLSTDGRYLTFMGYVAPVNAIDVSNSNTPLAVDPTNPVAPSYLRAVALVGRDGRFSFTETNAYSGNNGRAAILNNVHGADFVYTAGNAGNGANPQPNGVILGAGTQIIDPLTELEHVQAPTVPTPVASFSITELGAKADKVGKDDNFRGLTIFDNVLYYSKGSGGNGVNTVYFLDSTGTACPHGIGLPSGSATLPSAPLAYNLATLQTNGLPNNMCILKGFPSTPNKTATTLSYPFGIWFADANTVYLADEGDGYNGGADLYTHAAAETTAGLQKWVFNSGTQTWTLAYTLQTGLNLGVPYTVSGYPTGNNSVTHLPWAPATAGLRNVTGRVNGDGTVTIYAITSTVSGSGDQGADPNQLVKVTDNLSNTDNTVALSEHFTTLRRAGFAEVLRGVSFTPETDLTMDDKREGDDD